MSRREAFDDAECFVEQDTLVVVDDGVNLGLDTFPYLVESIFPKLKFVAETLKICLYAELVVGGGIAEVETSRYGQVGFEDESELGNDTFATGAGMGDKKTSFGGVKDALCRVYELANLKNGCPHGALTASDGGVAVAIVE